IHLPLVCAVPNATWLEHIPQLDRITHSRVVMRDGYALAPEATGLGIEWDWEAIARLRNGPPVVLHG
ncbi:MAG TPA: enolase C-terminal domain-like protein, partial [Burkholderiales bacterium]|nr:enolase C-terminal domain-like protein [Burkholderiales bacterium]